MVLVRRRGLRRAVRKVRRVRRGRRGMRLRMFRRVGNPTPTFTETFRPKPNQIADGGQLFAATIGGLPQYAQYANLYNQYRINWVKVILVADWNSTANDVNAGTYNNTLPINSVGMSRIVWAIQDTPLPNPAAGVPATEDQVLQDNGVKIRPLGMKWSCSFKPVVASDVTTGTGGATLARMRYKPFLNFTGNPAAETIHYGVQAWIAQVYSQAPIRYNVFYKINFTLRDPK